MLISGQFTLTIPIVIDTDRDTFEPGPDTEMIDEARTRFHKISARPHDPAVVEAALRNVAGFLAGSLDAFTTGAGVTFAIRLDPDVTVRNIRDALELYLDPVGIDPGELIAALDGIERLREHLEGKLSVTDDGEITQQVFLVSVPASGWILTSNGEWVPEGAKHERQRSQDAERERVISENEEIQRDRERRLSELEARIGRVLDERVDRARIALELAETERDALRAAFPIPDVEPEMAARPPRERAVPLVYPPPPPKRGKPTKVKPPKTVKKPKPKKGTPKKYQDRAGRWRWAVGPNKGRYTSAPKKR